MTAGAEPSHWAASIQETLVINPAVGCYYFRPGLWLSSQLQTIITLWPVANYTVWCQSQQLAQSHYMIMKWLGVEPRDIVNMMP